MNVSGSPASRWRCGCRFASERRSPSSFRPRSAPIAPAARWISACCDGLAMHVELAVILVGDVESKPFVKAPRGIGFDDTERDRLAGLRGLLNQALDHRGADAVALRCG